MHDTELISQILSGNRNAFAFLVSRYQKLVVHVAGRLIQSQDELEDVCQEVFLKVYQNLGNYRNECKLSTWIATIAYNTGINYLRKHKKWNEVNPEDSTALRNLTDFKVENYETWSLEYLKLGTPNECSSWRNTLSFRLLQPPGGGSLFVEY